MQNENILIEDYNPGKNDYGNISSYEIYTLKSIKDYFFIAYPSNNTEGIVKIYKYNYSNNKIELSLILNNLNEVMKIKYFYEPISKKEYLFIQMRRALAIFLIKNEKEYIIIKDFRRGLGGILSIFTKYFLAYPISDFEICFNQYNNKSYLIISMYKNIGCMMKENEIHIFNFLNDDLILIKTFIYQSKYLTKFCLIYKDKYKKSLNLMLNLNDNNNILKILELNDDIANIENIQQIPRLNNNIKGFDEIDDIKFNFVDKGCIIINDKNERNDIICLNCCDKLILIDLLMKKIIDIINLKNFLISKTMKSVVNSSNDKIIFLSLNEIFIFNVFNKQLLVKYNLKYGSLQRPIYLKKFSFNNSELLFIDGTDNKIRFILNK